jgi:hypothetical protein
VAKILALDVAFWQLADSAASCSEQTGSLFKVDPTGWGVERPRAYEVP